jgi:hypothetical protein
MAITWEYIASAAATGGNTASFTFSNIPQTFTDLAVKVYMRGAVNNVPYGSPSGRFNSSGALIYKSLQFGGAVTTPYSGLDNPVSYLTYGIVPTLNDPASYFGMIDVYIPDYSNTSKNKSLFTNATATEQSSGHIYFHQNRWNSTDAITSFTITDQTGGFGQIAQGSQATLYGIKKA